MGRSELSQRARWSPSGGNVELRFSAEPKIRPTTCCKSAGESASTVENEDLVRRGTGHNHGSKHL